jgi:hypothetical protein
LDLHARDQISTQISASSIRPIVDDES